MQQCKMKEVSQIHNQIKLIDRIGGRKQVIVTHHHKDHTKNLAKFKGIVHCTPVVSKLLTYGKYQIQTHMMNEMFTIGGLKIVFYDSGHSPGSVMVYIEDGRLKLLYTSDFRCDFQKIPKYIDVMYIDCTFYSEEFQFQDLQQAVLSLERFLLIHQQAYIRIDPITHYYFFQKYYEQTANKVQISSKNFNVLSLLDLNIEMFTVSNQPLWALDYKEYKQKTNKNDRICLIQTGWTFSKFVEVGKYSNEYVLPYTNHANFQELQELIAQFPDTQKYSINPIRNRKSKSIFSLENSLSQKTL